MGVIPQTHLENQQAATMPSWIVNYNNYQSVTSGTNDRTGADYVVIDDGKTTNGQIVINYKNPVFNTILRQNSLHQDSTEDKTFE